MRAALVASLRPLNELGADRPLVVSAGASSGRACVALARASRAVVLIAKTQDEAPEERGPIVVAARHGGAILWARRAARACGRPLVVLNAAEPPLIVTTEAPAVCATEVIEQSSRGRLVRSHPSIEPREVEVIVTSDRVGAIVEWAAVQRAPLIVSSAGSGSALQRLCQCFCSRLIDYAKSSVAIVPR